MRRKIMFFVAAMLLVASTSPLFGYCNQECRFDAAGEAYCALGLRMSTCDISADCLLICDCATCDCYWDCRSHCVGDMCLRA